LGKIGEIVVNDANTFDLTYAYGAIKGGQKIQAGPSLDVKITDDIKLIVGGGIEGLKYNAAYTEGSSYARGYYNGGAAYQPNNYNNIAADYLKNDTYEKYGVSYTHDFGNKFRSSI